MSLKVLIIEDEIDLAENISEYLIQHGYDVVGIIPSAEHVAEFLNNQTADLFLIDIMLKGNVKGIDIARFIRQKLPKCGIIFTTAMSGKSVLDKISDTIYDAYLLKPFSLKSLESSLYLISKKLEKPEEAENQGKKRNLLPIRDKGKIMLLDENEIHYIKAEGLYLRLFTETKNYLIRDLLKTFLPKLSQEKFLRIHKSYVVNLSKVRDLNSKECNILNQMIPIRRGYYKDFLMILQDKSIPV
jgi:two-component system, LytTR family, response regulator LytT